MNKKIIQTSGRRKRAIARATLKPGTGIVRINKKNIETCNPEMYRLRVQEPLILAGDLAEKTDIEISVNGGGIAAQADASRLAIARGLVQMKKDLHKTFIDYDRTLLIADVRFKEECKPNDSKARAKRQKSYR